MANACTCVVQTPVEMQNIAVMPERPPCPFPVNPYPHALPEQLLFRCCKGGRGEERDGHQHSVHSAHDLLLHSSVVGLLSFQFWTLQIKLWPFLSKSLWIHMFISIGSLSLSGIAEL